MPDFGFGDELDLPYEVRIRGVEVAGTAGEVELAPEAGAPVRGAAPGTLPEVLDASGQPSDAAARLGSVAELAGMRRELSLPLTDLAPAPSTGGTRGPGEVPHVEVTVPAPGDDEGQVVLEVDDTGTVRWHLSDTAVEGSGADRSGPTQTFRVPVAELDLPDTAADPDRGIVGFGLRKILHVLRFPVEAAAARAGELAVGWWERRHRPYGLDLVTAGTLRDPLGPAGVTRERLAALADRPFLLLVHGTFSRARSAYDGLAADTAFFAEMTRRYPDRILAFDHPTLHVDPDANVAWLRDRLPDVPLTFDVVCHSRGGLVGRRLADGPRHAGGPAPHVRTLVHVATPNAGTVLASRKRWGNLLDVFTNLLSLLPDSPGGIGLEGVIEVVKQVATGVVGGLDGLGAMDPQGAWLGRLPGGARSGTTVRAITSDWTPDHGAPLAVRALNRLVDPFFGSGNDAVVPTDGVARGAGGYTVADPFVVPTTGAVIHTRYFHDPDVRRTLAAWLPGYGSDGGSSS